MEKSQKKKCDERDAQVDMCGGCRACGRRRWVEPAETKRFFSWCGAAAAWNLAAGGTLDVIVVQLKNWCATWPSFGAVSSVVALVYTGFDEWTCDVRIVWIKSVCTLLNTQIEKNISFNGF